MCLWQVKSAEYSNRENEIQPTKTNNFRQTVNSDCDVPFVKKKLTNLGNTLR